MRMQEKTEEIKIIMQIYNFIKEHIEDIDYIEIYTELDNSGSFAFTIDYVNAVNISITRNTEKDNYIYLSHNTSTSDDFINFKFNNVESVIAELKSILP